MYTRHRVRDRQERGKRSQKNRAKDRRAKHETTKRKKKKTEGFRPPRKGGATRDRYTSVGNFTNMYCEVLLLGPAVISLSKRSFVCNLNANSGHCVFCASNSRGSCVQKPRERIYNHGVEKFNV